MSNNLYSMLPTLRVFSTRFEEAKNILTVPHPAGSRIYQLQMDEIKKMELISLHFLNTLLQQFHNNEHVLKQLNLLSNCWQTTLTLPSLDTTTKRVKALSDFIDSIITILETAEIEEKIKQLEKELEINNIKVETIEPSVTEEIKKEEEKKEVINTLPLPLSQKKSNIIMKKVRFNLRNEEKDLKESDKDIQTERIDNRKSFPRLRKLMSKVARRIRRD